MNLPETFVRRMMNLLGDEFREFEKSLDGMVPTSIRVNTKMDYRPSEEKVAWCDSGYYLKERPLFTADPFFHAGVYYVQEASSMFLYQAVKQHFADAQSVLDLCAAPGGKSTLLTQALPETCILVSNEIVRSRAYILAENLLKWGNPNNVVTNNEPKDFAALTGFFDAMVIDAPCSGEGMFRKDEGAISEWSEYNVTLCAARQKEIISAAWDSLKTEGVLVYSTCTFNREENEENVKWVCETLGAEKLEIDLKGNTDITVTDYGYRFYPHKTRGEGFFLTVLRKTSTLPSGKRKDREEKKNLKNVTKCTVPAFSLLNAGQWILIPDENRVKGYDKSRLTDYLFIEKQLKCMHSGLLLGEIKGKDFIPSAGIALSKMLDKGTVETVEVDYLTALTFLKKEAIFLPESPKGYLLICYKKQPLGWVKNLGNRTNNLYQNEWRIRMKLPGKQE